VIELALLLTAFGAVVLAGTWLLMMAFEDYKRRKARKR
jgi:hypothetical protein